MAYKNPPIETRFPVNRPYAPHTGHTGQYLTPLLKKLLNKETNIADPEVRKILNEKLKSKKATFKAILMLRYILNGVQGENQAIEGILDRIDGKTPQKLIGEGIASPIIIIEKYEQPKKEEDVPINRIAGVAETTS